MSRPKPEDDGKTQRPTGHYYVRLGAGPEWTPCCWYLRDGFWLVPGRQRPFIDSHLYEIDERPIVREESKKGNWTGLEGTSERIPQNE
jgi:hypothetical protein